jgi:hypothetical protein
MTEDPLLVAAAIYLGILAGDKYEPEMGEMPEPSWVTLPVSDSPLVPSVPEQMADPIPPVVAEVPIQTVDTTSMEASSGN